ncbi:hypothetical protein R1sor_008678 [Riccia sorocarpa]|uniref:Uncharacterized protein n=1 Tax=Riccia sorocarpa TaxID=122646 RepID=A0ABD3HU39_9MARC
MESVQTHYVIKVNHADTLRRLTLVKQPGGDSGLSFAELETKIREMFHFPASATLKLTYLDKDRDTVTLENDDDLRDACIYQGLNPLRLDVVLVSPEANSSGEPKRAPNFNTPFEGLEGHLTEVLKRLQPENLKNMLQAYEPIFREVRHPSQIPELVDNVVKIISSQFASLSRDAGVGTGNAGASTSPAPTPNKDQTLPQDCTRVQGPVCESVHHGVECDACGKSPIVGVRYKSTVKENYDLCSSCHAKAGARAGEYIIVNKPPFRGRHFHHGRMMGPSPLGTFGPMRHPRCGMRAPHDWNGVRLDARFVCDVSIFDGTQLAPGTPFTKIWRLRNSGSAAWPASTKLVNVDGDDLGSPTVTQLEIGEQGLAPEEEIDVSVDCVAPQRTGRYQSTWRLATPWGPKFGHKIWVQIQVVPAETLNQPAQVDTDGGVMEVGEPSIAREIMQVDQIEDLINLQDIPSQVDTSAQDVQVIAIAPEAVNDTAGLQEMSMDDVVQFTSDQEQTNSVGSEPTKNVDDSFVKVDVKNGGDETPDIQMTEMHMPPPLTEEVPETKTTTTTEEAVVQGTDRPDEATNVAVEFITTGTPVPKSAKAATDGDDVAAYDTLLLKLEAMGFTDRALNVELLKANAADLRKTVDALCEVEDWTPALAELSEMGFSDVNVNRRLMFKYGGNLKRVVKELVQIAKYSA